MFCFIDNIVKMHKNGKYFRLYSLFTEYNSDICISNNAKILKIYIMKDYVILNWKTGELMDSNFNPVNLEKAKIYDDLEYAINEIDCTGEPFCKVIEVSQLKEELQKTKKYNDLRGVDLFSLKYGQKFKILQEGWEGKTFVYQSQKTQPKSDRIWLYEKENHSGNKINISGNIACALKVQVIN